MATDFRNIDFAFRYGTQKAIDDSAYQNGTFNIATDTGELYIDIGGSRISMNKDIHLIETELELRVMANPMSDRVYYTKDTQKLYTFSDQLLRWVNIGGSPEEINARIDNLTEVVDSLHSFEIIILEPDEELPEEGQSNIVYFIPQELTDDSDTKYDEFVWIANEEYYEKIGITEADLGSYYKKSEIDAIVGANYVTDPESVNFKGVISDRLIGLEEKVGTSTGSSDPSESILERLVSLENRVTTIENREIFDFGEIPDPE